jgi:hypothetical protein
MLRNLANGDGTPLTKAQHDAIQNASAGDITKLRWIIAAKWEMSDIKDGAVQAAAVFGTIKTYYKPDPAIHGYATNLDYFNAQ